MEIKKEPKNASLSNYLYILYKWKKFIFINLVVVGLITTIWVLLLPNQYKATATLMIPADNQMGLGGLSNLLGGKSTIASMGSRFFGVSNTTEDMVIGILHSRSTLLSVIKRFNLMEYYDISDNNIDKGIKAFKNDISGEPNEYGMIEFTIVNKNPNVSAEIANYLVALVDSLNIEFNIERAKNNRLFIEKRYLKNIADLKNAEDSLYNFQRKYGIVAVPEQLEVTVKAAAEVEAELLKKEMQSYFAQQLYGENSPQYVGANAEVTMLRNKVQELKNSRSLGSSSNILFPFKEMPDIAIQYLRAFREVEIQQTIMEFVMPMYEQAKVEEQKSAPTVMIIDRAVPPQLKDSPKRATLVISILFLVTFMLIPIVFMGEEAIKRAEHINPLQFKISSFYRKVLKLYKMNL